MPQRAPRMLVAGGNTVPGLGELPIGDDRRTKIAGEVGARSGEKYKTNAHPPRECADVEYGVGLIAR